ncbi:unnamed protein product, partial [Darwinula stevensoni]
MHRRLRTSRPTEAPPRHFHFENFCPSDPLDLHTEVFRLFRQTLAKMEKGALLAEGKTKRIYEIPQEPGLVLVESKDRLTAFGGAKSHEVDGKAHLATRTTSLVFAFLRDIGMKTHFVREEGEKAFVARRCHMIPLEFVTRRVATGSYLKRHPHVGEGFRFSPPK